VLETVILLGWGSGELSGSQGTLSGLQWHDPIEGLEFGEIFLGGIISTYFARGRVLGYGFCFTDRRIIGFKMRGADFALRIGLFAGISILYTIAIFETLSGVTPLLLLLPLAIHMVGFLVATGTRRVSENLVSRKAQDTSFLMSRRRDLEFRRGEIGEVLMKSPEKWSGLLGRDEGYIRITPKDPARDTRTIKIHGKNKYQTQYLDLRDLVINFTSKQPRVSAMEYPMN
jgi:hypothetical protein